MGMAPTENGISPKTPLQAFGSCINDMEPAVSEDLSVQ